LKGEIAAATGLRPDAQTLCGAHDNNAPLTAGSFPTTIVFKIVVFRNCAAAISPAQFFGSAEGRSFVPAVQARGARRAAKVKDGAQRRRRFILDGCERRARLAPGRALQATGQRLGSL
jgi:hypothetical protein